jgi:hypothetical protein
MTPAMFDENSSLLSTEYVPGVAESSVIRVRAEEKRGNYRIIDERITNPEGRLLELQAQRDGLIHSCAVGEVLLEPIRKLPVHIL